MRIEWSTGQKARPDPILFGLGVPLRAVRPEQEEARVASGKLAYYFVRQSKTGGTGGYFEFCGIQILELSKGHLRLPE